MKNELRPFEYIRNYAQDIQMQHKHPGSRMVQSDSRIIHASPFRATIKIDETFVTD
jgi:hypothetical protein